MEESNELQQQDLLLLMQHQQKLQQRQQQLFLMQHLQKQQQNASISRFPINIDPHLRPPVNQFLQNANPNLLQQATNFQQQQQHNMRLNQQMMMMQQEQKLGRPLNHIEMQFAYQDAWRVCNPDFKRPFASLEDACERLLPYHVVADYEAEEDDKILNSDTTNQPLSRSQQWDNNIADKVSEFTATFEKLAHDFNMITQKRSNGEQRAEERLMIEQVLLQDEQKTCVEVKSELDKEVRLRMAALSQVRAVESQQRQSHGQMMPIYPLRGNVNQNHGGERDHMNSMMMLMNGYNNNSNSQREVKEPLEDFLNDEEKGEHENWRQSGQFDLNTR